MSDIRRDLDKDFAYKRDRAIYEAKDANIAYMQKYQISPNWLTRFLWLVSVMPAP